MTFRVAVSNIAWPFECRQEIYALLREAGVDGVEIAPTKIAPWDNLSSDVIAAERSLIASFGLKISSYQALYFGRPELQLLGDDSAFEALLAHTVRVARIAEQLSGGGPGVFGAPRNRLRGELSAKEAFAVGTTRLGRLADAVAPYNFILVLEAAPAAYGGDFLLTAADCAAMVKKIDHPALRLHLDTGCLELADEDGPALIAEHGGQLMHVHLSRPQLAPVDMDASLSFSKILRGLEHSGYAGWLAIEMRETPTPCTTVENAVSAVRAALA